MVLVPLRPPRADTGWQGGPAPFGHATASKREASPWTEILLQLKTDKGTVLIQTRQPKAKSGNTKLLFQVQISKGKIC